MPSVVTECIFLKPGEYAVCRSPGVLATLLGSCVAICLWDSRARIAGMNHYSSPSPHPYTPVKDSRFGSVAIPALIEEMLMYGASLQRIQARIAGGGRPAGLITALDVGRENRMIAEEILAQNSIPVVETVYPAKGIKIRMDSDDGRLEVQPIRVPESQE